MPFAANTEKETIEMLLEILIWFAVKFMFDWNPLFPC